MTINTINKKLLLWREQIENKQNKDIEYIVFREL
jgi:hypothetical protein